jgi:hypothetical protein
LGATGLSSGVAARGTTGGGGAAALGALLGTAVATAVAVAEAMALADGKVGVAGLCSGSTPRSAGGGARTRPPVVDEGGLGFVGIAEGEGVVVAELWRQAQKLPPARATAKSPM